MTKSGLAVLAAIVCLTASCAFAEANAAKQVQPVGDFALLDHEGYFHQLSRYGDREAVVVFVTGNGCPIARLAMPALEAVRDEFSETSIPFLLMNSNAHDDLEEIRAEAAEFEIDFPILIDEAQLVAESLNVERTCEVFVIDAKKMEILYRGPINDQFDYEVQRAEAQKHYLRDVVAAVVAGEDVTIPSAKVKGCLVSYPQKKADEKRQISYVDEVAPILMARCTSCHMENGIAPFAMDGHDSVVGWSEMIRETVMTTRMPPGQIDREFGEWSDVHMMYPEEKATLVHWIESGSPKDGETDPLAKVESGPEGKWRLGEPDLIVEIPPQDVPATGVVDYRYVTLPLELDEVKWLRGYEFYIDHPAVVHHITTSTVTLGGENEDENPNDASRTGFAGFAPGKPLLLYPENVGYKVGPGTAIRASLHYTPNGKAVVDNSKIGLYFRDDVPEHEIRRWSPGTADFVIPPHVSEHPVHAEAEVKYDTWLFNLQPHMHVRGKRVSYTAIFEDGREEKLLSVPNYQFNWQMIYTPKEPIFLPKGTKIVLDGAFDNSEMNLTNPDPSQEVRFGPQSWDEMFLAHMQIAAKDESEVVEE